MSAPTLIPSKYNVCSRPVSGRVAIFNTLTQNIALFDSNDIIDGAHYSSIKADELCRLGFLVNADVSEIDRVYHVRERMAAANKGRLAVTITPTLRCNFSCAYCYNGVNHGDIIFDPSIALSYINDTLRHGERLHITWYGGEPLIMFKEIVDLSNIIMDLCASRNSTYSADIVTNGFLLTEEMGGVLQSIGIDRLQISFDCPLGISGRREKGNCPADFFRKALNSINYINNSVDVNIRVNVAPGFLGEFDEFIGYIKEIVRRDFWVYAHRLITDGVLRNKFAYNSLEKFFSEYRMAKAILRSRGIQQEYFPHELQSGICIAQTPRDVIFSPDGMIRKCVRELVGNNCAGALRGGTVIGANEASSDRFEYYRKIDIFSDEQLCIECKYLPICFGGCVKEAYDRFASTIERCTPWKFIMIDELTDYVSSLSDGGEL